MGSASSANQLMLGRAITGLAAAAWVPLVVAFSRLFPPKEAVRASALLTMIGSSGRILATFSNGPLNEIGGYSLAFDVAVGVAAVAFLIAATSHETPLPRRNPSISGIARLISRRDVLLPAVLNGVVQYANWASTFGFLPVLAKGLNASDVTVSTIVSINLVLGLMGNLGATTMVRRLGAQRLSFFGFILLTLGLAGTAMARSVPMLFATQCLIGLAVGLSYPVLMGMSIRNVDEVERTTAMGLHQSVYAAGMFFGPWVSGIMAEAIGVRPTFAFTAVACFTLGVIGTRMLVDQMKD
jgi:MFS family permease